jgi:chromosome condensin MukBEF ATPase and DNA-binding subunit MukB
MASPAQIKSHEQAATLRAFLQKNKTSSIAPQSSEAQMDSKRMLLDPIKVSMFDDLVETLLSDDRDLVLGEYYLQSGYERLSLDQCNNFIRQWAMLGASTVATWTDVQLLKPRIEAEHGYNKFLKLAQDTLKAYGPDYYSRLWNTIYEKIERRRNRLWEEHDAHMRDEEGQMNGDSIPPIESPPEPAPNPSTAVFSSSAAPHQQHVCSPPWRLHVHPVQTSV